MGIVTFGKRAEVSYNTETFGFFVKKDGVTFHTAEDFEPYLRLKDNTKLPLSAAAAQNTVSYPSGVGDGILAGNFDQAHVHRRGPGGETVGGIVLRQRVGNLTSGGFQSILLGIKGAAEQFAQIFKIGIDGAHG